MVIDLENDVELIPVIEFEPGRYQLQDRAGSYPKALGKDAPDAWHAYWRDSLADAGLVDLEPVPDTWVVPTERLVKPDDLRILLRTAVIAPALEAEPLSLTPERLDLDNFGALSGGFALQSPRGWHVTPQCCGDLSDLGGWRDAAAGRHEEWRQLWIGHPWISYRFLEGRVELSDFSESAEPVTALRIDPQALQSAVRGAEHQLRLFHARLLPVLRMLVDAAVADPLADVLVWEAGSSPGGRS